MLRHKTGLRNYGRIIYQRRWVIFTIIAAVFIPTLIYTILSPPVYQATARMRITERKTVSSDKLIAAQIDPALRQRAGLEIMELTAVKLGLIPPNTPYRNKAETRVMRALQRATTTHLVKGTDMFEIVVTYSNPTSACVYANAIARAYEEYILDKRIEEISKMCDSFQRNLAETKTKLEETESRLRSGKKNYKVNKMALAIYNRLEDLKKTRSVPLSRPSGVSGHPDIIQLDEQMNTLKQALTKYSQDEIELCRLRRAVNELRLKLTNITMQIPTPNAGIRVIQEATIPSQSITRGKTIKLVIGLCFGLISGLATAFFMGYQETSTNLRTQRVVENIASLLKLPVLGIIPPLATPTSPTLAKGGIGKYKPTSIERALGRSATKEIHHIEVLKNQLIINYSASSLPTSRTLPKGEIGIEAYHILRTNVVRDTAGLGTRIILITSARPLEGKTLTTLNLAMVMAEMNERVLVIDADMRPDKSVGIHKIFGLDKAPGLNDLLMGTSNLDVSIRDITDILVGGFDYDLIVKTPGIDNLNFITAGTSVPEPSEVLGATNLDALLRDLRAQYDYILIDCPPILPVADTLIIGPKTTSVILVYRVGHTAKSALVQAKADLIKANIPIKGIVFNHMTSRTLPKDE